MLMASIVGEEKEQSVTYYRIMVMDGMKEWVISRRFNEFEALEKELTRLGPNAVVHDRKPLPPKGVIGFRHLVAMAGGAEKRKTMLDEYITHLAQEVGTLDRCAVIEKFFTLGKMEYGTGKHDLVLASDIEAHGANDGKELATSSHEVPSLGKPLGSAPSVGKPAGGAGLAAAAAKAVENPHPQTAVEVAKEAKAAVVEKVEAVQDTTPVKTLTALQRKLNENSCFACIGVVVFVLCFGHFMPEATGEVFGEGPDV